MQTLFTRIYDALAEHMPVYPSFDAVPVEKKPGALFAVLDMPEISMGMPAMADGGLLQPFQAEISVTLLMPMYGDFRQAMDCFYETVVPVMLSMDCTVERIRTKAVTVDHKLRKLTFGGSFIIRGMYLVPPAEKEESA